MSGEIECIIPVPMGWMVATIGEEGLLKEYPIAVEVIGDSVKDEYEYDLHPIMTFGVLRSVFLWIRPDGIFDPATGAYVKTEEEALESLKRMEALEKRYQLEIVKKDG